MNILIVVGLLVVGIAAIVGVVLIGFSDQRKETAQTNNLKQEHEIKTPAPAAPVQLTTPTEPKEVVPSRPLADQLVTRPLADLTASRPGHASTSLTTLTTLEGVQNPPVLNGQFHELANEIRSLHQQATQLEQRLSILTEMINHLESSQSKDFDLDDLNDIDEEEQTHVPSENTLRNNM